MGGVGWGGVGCLISISFQCPYAPFHHLPNYCSFHIWDVLTRHIPIYMIPCVLIMKFTSNKSQDKHENVTV